MTESAWQFIRRHLAPVFAATVWISLCEFLRNELWLKHLWVGHYAKLGLAFPDAPMNNATWGLWALALAASLKWLLTRFPRGESALLAWLIAFGLMWIVTGNLGVLPLAILPYAVPFSLIEVYGASWLLEVTAPRHTPDAAHHGDGALP